jgi:5S rRNA maturation endonuclease (ribonuclease M5)
LEQVFVLGSSKWVEGQNSARVLNRLRDGLPHFERVVVLMDPDVSGRQGRNILEAAFPGRFWHAFLPAQLATSVTATRQNYNSSYCTEIFRRVVGLEMATAFNDLSILYISSPIQVTAPPLLD